jgi:hypothetical protein
MLTHLFDGFGGGLTWAEWVAKSKRRKDRRLRRQDLTLESLEERALPSVTIYTGGNSLHDNNWSDPANWSAGVPGPGVIAEFNTDSAETQFSTMDIPILTIEGLMLTAAWGPGGINIDGHLTLSGDGQWDAGILSIDSSKGGMVTNMGTITSQSGISIVGNGTFVNLGTIITRGGDNNIGGYNNGQGDVVLLDNAVGGVIDFQSDGGFTSGNGYVHNAGTIMKTGGTGTSSIFVAIENSGTIDAETGTIHFLPLGFSGTGTSVTTEDSNGTFKTAAGATIELADNGYPSFVQKGTMTAIGAGTILLDQGNLSIDPAGATINVASTVTFSWRDGSINVPPLTTLTYNGALSLQVTDFISGLYGGGTFVENGIITESGSGSWFIDGGDSSVTTLRISPGSILDFQSDAGIDDNNGGGANLQLLDNAGTIEKTGGSGTSDLQLGAINNLGTIRVSSGTLDARATGSPTFVNAGSLEIGAGSVLEIGTALDGQDFAQTPAGYVRVSLSSLANPGQIQVNGNARLTGSLGVDAAPAFVPSGGDSFTVVSAGSVSGRFSRLTGMVLPNRRVLSPNYTSTAVILDTFDYPLLPIPAQLGQVAGALAHSAEHYQQFVKNAYHAYLGRSPLSSELNGWVIAMQAGLTDEHVEAFFIGAPEYIANHGGGGAGWVRGLYHDLLGRTPSDSEVNTWVQAINGGVSTEAIAYEFAASMERESIRVGADYQTFLGRTPTQAEISGWVIAFANGLTNEGLVAGFLGSPEYYNNPIKGNGDNRDWMIAAVHDDLNRTANPAEISAAETALMPANAAAVAGMITGTVEYYANFVTNAYETYLGRTPDQIDPNDVNNWALAMQGGLSDEQLEAQFIGSAEYFATHGGTAAGFVRGLYHDLLGRQPSDAEVGSWVQALNSGESSVTIALGFTASAERESIRVLDDYFHYLGRSASPAEVGGWVNSMLHGLSNETVVADLLASPEYYNAAGKGGSAKAAWLSIAFLDVLDRAPQASEFQSLGRQLQ